MKKYPFAKATVFKTRLAVFKLQLTNRLSLQTIFVFTVHAVGNV